MKKVFLASAIVASVAAVSATGALTTTAFAQSAVVTTTTTGAAPSDIVIEPEYRTRIKSYVTEQRIAPVTTREKIVVGATLPQDVELRSVPADWGPHLSKYRYIYSDNHVMLVEPSSRRVVRVVD